MSASVPYTFVALTTAEAGKVNSNFTALVNYLNASVSLADASVAYTGIPLLPSDTPTTDNQATRKAYVDTVVDASRPRRVRTALTTGNVALTSTSYADVTGMTVTVAATAGDLLMVLPNFRLGTQDYVVDFDIMCTTSSNRWNGTTDGFMGWKAAGGGVATPVAGGVTYPCVTGDISGGNVALKLRYKLESSGSRNLLATSAGPAILEVVNLGAVHT